MKISEAALKGISRLRQSHWNPTAYLVIHIVRDSEGCPIGHGPWAKLFDRASEIGMERAGLSQKVESPMPIPIIQIADEEFEEYIDEKGAAP